MECVNSAHTFEFIKVIKNKEKMKTSIYYENNAFALLSSTQQVRLRISR